MNCNNCGFEFEGNFCPMCGTKAQPYSENNPYEQSYQTQYNPPYVSQSQPYNNFKPRKHKKGFVLDIIIVLAVALVGSVMLYIAPLGLFACFDYIDSMDVADRVETHSVTESAVLDNFRYSIENISYTDTYNKDKPQDGYEFMKVKLRITNISNSGNYVSSDTEVYVDDVLYDEYDDFSDDYYENELAAGKTMISERVYEIPKNRNKIEFDIRGINDIFGNTVIKYNIFDNELN